MKRIKIVEAGWENYTAELAGIQFVDGVSVGPVPRHQADRVGGMIKVIEIDADGEGEPVGSASRLVGGVTIAAPVVDGLRQPTPEEVEAERHEMALQAKNKPASTFYSREALEEIADLRGLKGLRQVAGPWNVRDRSIPSLINEILSAQEKYMQRLEAAGVERPVLQGPDIVVLDEFGNIAPQAPAVSEAPLADKE